MLPSEKFNEVMEFYGNPARASSRDRPQDSIDTAWKHVKELKEQNRQVQIIDAVRRLG